MERGRGFTLIELLVVIAIIALLMSILMPALARVRNQAKTVVCQSNVRQLGLGFSMYVDNHNGYFDEGWIPGYLGDRWPYYMLPYYGDVKLLLCPMANKFKGIPGTLYGRTFGAWSYEGIWNNPAHNIGKAGLGPEDGYGDGSYCVNGFYANARPETEAVFDPQKKGFFWKTPNVRGTKNIPLLTDGIVTGGYPQSSNDMPPEARDLGGGATGFHYIRNHCRDRHSGHVDAVFLDFSTRKVGLKELWTFEWYRGDNYTTNPYVISAYGGGAQARADCAARWDNPTTGAPWMKNMKEY